MYGVDTCQFGRAIVDFPVTIQIDSNQTDKLIARARSISLDGICFWLARILPVNVPFVLHFPSEWQQAFAIARVVERNGFFYSCQFIEVPPWVQGALEKVMRNYPLHESSHTLHTLWESSLQGNNL